MMIASVTASETAACAVPLRSSECGVFKLWALLNEWDQRKPSDDLHGERPTWNGAQKRATAPWGGSFPSPCCAVVVSALFLGPACRYFWD